MRLILILALASPLLAADGTFEDKFERDKIAPWSGSGGWSIVPEPGNAANRVLQYSTDKGSGGTLHLPGRKWGDAVASARMKITTERNQAFHVKLICRADGKCDYALNARSTGPYLIERTGTRFTGVGPVGGFTVKNQQWYRLSIKCAGPVIECKVTNEGNPGEAGVARYWDEAHQAGGIKLAIHRYGKEPFTVIFDDVKVEPLSAKSVRAGRTCTIRSDELRLDFDTLTGRFDVTDLRSGHTWRQSIRGSALPGVQDVQRSDDGRSLTAQLDTPAGRMKLALAIEPHAEVLVSIKPVENRWAALAYPMAFMPSPKDAYVLPVDEGVLLPATDVNRPRAAGLYRYGQGSLIMPWFGILDETNGMMWLIETPFDFHVALRRARPDGPERLVGFVRWDPSKVGVRYERRLRLCFFDKGGYVAMAKRYREHRIAEGTFRTVEAKAKEIPNVRKLVGAINILDHTPARDAKHGDDLIDWMIANGIRRALYSTGGRQSRIDKALKAGYVVNRYDNVIDIAGPKVMEARPHMKKWKNHQQTEGYPDECYVRRDGSFQPGWSYPINVKAALAGDVQTVRGYYRCSACKLQWLKRRIPEEIKKHGYTVRFIDVETAVAPFECYSSKHPLTREQDMKQRIGLFDYLRSLGQICSSEGGADWAHHALHYTEGSLTLSHFGWLRGVYVGTMPFSVNEKNPDYFKSNLDPRWRLPLHELVWHDCTFMTWRWNHSPNRWHERDMWDLWDLVHILNAQMPIIVARADGLPDYGDRILQTYRNVCVATLEKVGGVEMTDHTWLTPDRMVQQTTFANGYRVVVNFRDKEAYRCEDGVAVKARGFRVWQRGSVGPQ